MMNFGQLCCGCNEGAIVPRWENVGKVRFAAFTNGMDISGGLTYSDATPFARKFAGTYDGVHLSPACSALPPGICGTWLAVGDLNGVSAQEVQDMVDDIIACAASDSTHVTKDHNCYFKNGDTVDMRVSQRFGAQWILAMKNWHGTFGFLSNDACAKDPNIAPDQTKYLTITGSGTHWVIDFDDPDAKKYGQTYSGTSTIGRLTGINAASNTTEHIGHPNGISVFDNVGSNFYCDAVGGLDDVIAGVAAGLNEDGLGWLGSWSKTNTTFTLEADRYSGVVFAPDPTITEHYEISVVLSDAYTADDCLEDWRSAMAAWDMSDFTVAKLRTDEELANAMLILYDETGPVAPQLINAISLWGVESGSDAAIRSSGTMDDFNTPVTDSNGNAPFTSVTNPPPSGWTYNPGNNGSAIGDGTNPAHWPGWTPTYDGTPIDWQPTYDQITWIDPANYIWKFAGSVNGMPAGWNGGATLVTPLRTGEIIAHTAPGSDRHFWFDFTNLIREFDEDNSRYEWAIESRGAFSASPLPNTTMRWQNKQAAQYDGIAYFGDGVTAPPGNLPQAFLRQQSGVLIGAKYVQATQVWPAVNYGQPCADMKYDVDRTTVCCVLSTGTGTFTVKATGNAIPPLATGGLTANDYIIRPTDGVYKLTSITDDGTVGGFHQFTLNVGAKIDDPPTGGITYDDARDDIDWTGRLRFPSAPGICGRVAVTPSFDSGTGLVTLSMEDMEYLRIDPATGLISVDFYDASMGSLATSVALTRVSDASFTFTHAAMPTAAFITGAGVDWTKYDSTSKRTGVHLEWTFDQRKQAGASVVAHAISVSDPDAAAIQSAYEAVYGSYPPAWYASTDGCTGCPVDQFNYETGVCKAVVGIVPFYSSSPLESFSNSTLFEGPTMLFDDVFGACAQAAVMLTMPDPFWQQPFKPDCDIASPDTITWTEDDGSGQVDTTVSIGGGTQYQDFYAHHKFVEASSVVPSGMSLPAGITLAYDPAYNQIAPPFYPNGIPIGDVDGNFGGVASDWGFAIRACDATRFAGVYSSFTDCPVPV